MKKKKQILSDSDENQPDNEGVSVLKSSSKKDKKLAGENIAEFSSRRLRNYEDDQSVDEDADSGYVASEVGSEM